MGILSGLVGGAEQALGHTVNAISAPVSSLTGYSLGNGFVQQGKNITNPTVNAYGTPYFHASAPVKANEGSPTTNSGPLSQASAYGSGGSTYDPQSSAYYQSQIDQAQNQLNSYDPLQNQLIANVDNSYNTGLKGLNDSQAVAQRNYDTSKDNTIQDNVNAKSQIDSSVRSNTNALQRLLGLAGSGNSSAADYANYAAARQGTQQRQQVQDNYGKNLQALDTSFGDTTNAYNSGLSSLADQKKANENSVISDVNNNRSKLLSTLAQLRSQQAQAQGQTLAQAQAAANPYTQQIQAINAQAAGLAQNYANPTISTQGVAFAAPTLASYATDGAAVDPSQNTNAVSDTVSPIYANLLNKDKTTGALIA